MENVTPEVLAESVTALARVVSDPDAGVTCFSLDSLPRNADGSVKVGPAHTQELAAAVGVSNEQEGSRMEGISIRFVYGLTEECAAPLLDALGQRRKTHLKVMRCGASCTPALTRLIGAQAANLQEIDLEFNGIGEGEKPEELMAAFGACANLKRLSLRCTVLPNDAMAALGQSVRALPQLKDLDLGLNLFDKTGLQAFAEAVTAGGGGCPRLERLDLSFPEEAGKDPGQAVAALLTACPSLRKLDLADARLSEEGSAAVLVAAAAHPVLAELQMNRCELRGQGEAVRALLASRGGQPSPMRVLRLVECSLQPEDVVAMAPALGAGSALEELALSGNQMAAAGAVALAAALVGAEEPTPTLDAEPHNSSLRRLEVAMCGLEEESWEAVGRIAKWHTGLRELTLSGNRLGSEGLLVICSAIAHYREMAEDVQGAVKHHSPLTKLRLTQCSLPPAAAEAMATAWPQEVASQLSLRALIFTSNELGAAGAAALRPVLCSIPTLDEVSVASNGIDGAGAEAMQAFVSSKENLRVFNYGGNAVDGAGCRAWAEALAPTRRLERLSLAAAHIQDQEAIQALEEPLLANERLHKLYLPCAAVPQRLAAHMKAAQRRSKRTSRIIAWRWRARKRAPRDQAAGQ